MISISLLIAWRYISETKKIKGISTMVKMSFISIFIGTFSLALAISIMNGFEKVTKEKMQNIHPQITIQATNYHLNYEQISKILDNEFPEIESYSPSDIQFAIIKTDYDNDISNVIAIKGVDPKKESKMNGILSKIIERSNESYENLFNNNQIIIGKKLAKELNLSVGDEITFLIPQKINISKVNFEKQRAFISGLFDTGIDDFDNKVVFSSMNFISSTFPDSGISQIGIKLKKNIDEDKLILNLKNRFKLNVYSWKDQYSSIVSTLKLERYITFFIFFLISLIASINIISLLFMIINYKRKDLILLKSMGLNDLELQKIFLFLGMFITLLANISGLLFAFIIALILKKYPFIKLPDLYYSTYLPIHIDVKTFILIFLLVNLIGLISSWFPSRKILSSNIANTLKNEN